MKKILSVVFICFTVFQSLFAQKIGIGVRANFHFANFNLPQSVNDAFTQFGGINNLTAVGAAIPVEIGLSDMFSIQAEVMYLQKGFTLTTNILGLATYEGNQKVNYLEIPLMAKLNFLADAPFNISILAGLSFGYALSGRTYSKAMVITSGIAQITDDPVDFKDFNRFEIGAHLGVNLGFKVGSGKLILDGRYLLGLTKLNNAAIDLGNIPNSPTTPNSTSNDVIKNRGFSVGLGYMHYF
jgi:Outer membrane protein beta-barrel domain